MGEPMGSPTGPSFCVVRPVTAGGPPAAMPCSAVDTRAPWHFTHPPTDEDMVSKRSPTPSERVRFLPSVLHVPARPRVG